MKFFIFGTYLYLIIPCFIFFMGWMTLSWGLFFSFLLLSVSVLFWRRLSQLESSKLPVPIKFSFFFLLTLLVVLAGYGGFFYQNPDFLKHNGILSDLIRGPWPLFYSFLTRDTFLVPFDETTSVKPLVYSLGIYWPAALIVKALPLHLFYLSSLIFGLWVLVGVFLMAYWWLILVKGSSIPSLFLWMLWGGGDFFMWMLFHREIPLQQATVLEWWSWPWQFSSHMTLLSWVPQHMIPAHLGGAFFLYTYESKTKERGLLYSLPVMMMPLILWSPFAVIGLIPFVLFVFVKKIYLFLRLENILSIILLVPLVLYILSNDLGHPHGWIDLSNRLVQFLCFHLSEWLGIVCVWFFFSKVSSLEKKILFISSMTLVSVSLYRYGLLFDGCMRISIPSLFFLNVLGARRFFYPGPLKIFMGALVIFGSGTFFMELKNKYDHRHDVIPRIQGQRTSFMPPLSILKHNIGPQYMSQYLGRSDSFFFKHFVGHKN